MDAEKVFVVTSIVIFVGRTEVLAEMVMLLVSLGHPVPSSAGIVTSVSLFSNACSGITKADTADASESVATTAFANENETMMDQTEGISESLDGQ